jgi:hypothetical protein
MFSWWTHEQAVPAPWRGVMMSNMIIDWIFTELRKAEEKHPGWPNDYVHMVGIVTEEVGEAMREAIDIEYKMGRGTRAEKVERLRKELTQSAAMAIRALCWISIEEAPIEQKLEEESEKEKKWEPQIGDRVVYLNLIGNIIDRNKRGQFLFFCPTWKGGHNGLSSPKNVAGYPRSHWWVAPRCIKPYKGESK